MSNYCMIGYLKKKRTLAISDFDVPQTLRKAPCRSYWKSNPARAAAANIPDFDLPITKRTPYVRTDSSEEPDANERQRIADEIELMRREKERQRRLGKM